MGQPYIGEIRMFAGNFAPVNWALCNGQMMSINENTALYQLIGTTYGGDGVNSFQLPDLRSRVPVHAGTSSGGNYLLGQVAGVENVTLTTQQMPKHSHALNATNSGEVLAPAANTFPALATSTPQQPGSVNMYEPASTANTTLNPATITLDGGNQPHSNIQPFVAINFIISLVGVFPTQG
jgi:microcystin-dependent protein